MMITVTPTGTLLEITLSGRLDTSNYAEFEDSADKWLDGRFNHLVLNCTALDYISSSGLRVLLSIQKRVIAKGFTFSLYGLQPIIRDIFNITGFSTIFSIYADRNDVPLNDSFNFTR